MNDFSKEFWKERGISRFTVPYELNEKEIRKRNDSDSELIVYGRIPLMISAQCLEKTCGSCRKKTGRTKEKAPVFLHDRKGARFPVLLDCDFCYNIIYNSVPLSLVSLADQAEAAGAGSFRFEFTDEDPKTAVRIVRAFADNQNKTKNSAVKEWYGFTRGHFTRGVL